MISLSQKLNEYYWDICQNLNEFQELDDSKVKTLKSLMEVGVENLIEANASIKDIENAAEQIQEELLAKILSGELDDFKNSIPEQEETESARFLALGFRRSRCWFWPFCWR